jgi:hypothetical protein
MAVIKLIEDYAVRQLRNDVRDSLTLAGEQAILLQTYHAGDEDAEPCSECGDDVYNSPEKGCTQCYGTMFDKGVRQARKVWCLFTDHQVSEQLGKQGVYEPDHRSVQFEAFPLVTEHDVLARVRQWNSDGSPQVLEGYYMLGQVDRRSLRTGSRFGQFHWDVVGQRSQVAELPTDLRKGITRYPIIGQVFTEPVPGATPTAYTPTTQVIEPDTRVVYFPFHTAGDTDTGGTTELQGVTFTQAIPSNSWTINHTLGYNPVVSVIVNGGEVDAQIEYPNTTTVVITFGIPVAGTARLV